jgi:fructose-bisphosphate aldolase class II
MTIQNNLHVYPMKTLLAQAERGAYAVGSFSPRCTPMIAPVLRAAMQVRSPLIVQISQREMEWAGLTPAVFAAAFYAQVRDHQPGMPAALHLDHTWDLDIIQEAIESGFTSVMIDASSKELEENIAITRKVVAMAHPRGVTVEAELGRIFSADQMETESDEELYTDPDEAATFVRETGLDALAVSVGTAHGVYQVRQPKIDLPRLQAIHRLTPVHLVLHGGSGVPEAMMASAIHLPGGGVSKINIATDLEIALLAELGLPRRIPNEALLNLPAADLQRGAQAVQAVVVDKMVNFLGSDGKADSFQA